MIAGYQGVFPALRCYPALVRKWQKGRLTAAQRKEISQLKRRIELLLTLAAAVLVAAQKFTGKVMTEEPNVMSLNVAQAFVVK